MRRHVSKCIGTLMLIGSFLYADFTISEIYQWTDAEGNVHFGDKPKDAEQARDAKPVELKEGYRPPERSAEELDYYHNAQQASAAKNRKRQSLVRDVEDEQDEERRQKKEELCNLYQEKITELSTSKRVNGILTNYYLKGEDGKSISSERQREIVEEMREKMASEGCN